MQRRAQEEKLNKARANGKVGWENAKPIDLHNLLTKAVDEEDYVSVANYAGMLYCHNLDASPPPQTLTRGVVDGPQS
jgi:hypothetical protein